MVQDFRGAGALLGNITKEIRELMQRFQRSKIQYVDRMGNEAAHKLARYDWNVDDINVWWGSFSNFISKVIWTDKRL